MLNDEEIEAAEKLRAKGELTTALVLTQDMLVRAEDEYTRMRLLFDVLYCSMQLRLDEVTNGAISELERMSQPRMSRVFVDFIQATSDIAHGHFQRGLDLIDTNLKSEFMKRDDFLVWKYKHLAYKGSALVGLDRCPQALSALAEAHRMNPNGDRETAILIDQANCLLALDKYDESYKAASQVPSLESATDDGGPDPRNLQFQSIWRLIVSSLNNAGRPAPRVAVIKRHCTCELRNPSHPKLMGEALRSQGRSKWKRYRLFLRSSAIVILINPSIVWVEMGFSKCLMRN